MTGDLNDFIEIIIRLTKTQKEGLVLKLPFAIYVVLRTLNSLTSITLRFKKALEIDVKCFEALNELVINHMMTSKEEWDFVNSLKFDEQLQYEEAYFIKNELHINAEEV
ncbi:ApcC hetero-tetramer Cut9-Hcn1 [Gigaspora margarita]|uniref:ApcC hetero-tetramer Cut9-Hcn1 n=1 Tax=Gigaspora margarita TaxID=4874 RepID=A0A8H4A959_GIGMA|nr:ApcC hetero-tetramer Cut9-Hcn1 [Gigaspora margarita]